LNALDLLQDLEARGVILTPHDGKLTVDAPLGALNAVDRERLTRLKPALLALLIGRQGPACPTCKRPLDDKLCCWKCSYRSCAAGCGRNTGTEFAVFCLQCENLMEAEVEGSHDGV
jgi:hypothetical protein